MIVLKLIRLAAYFGRRAPGFDLPIPTLYRLEWQLHPPGTGSVPGNTIITRNAMPPTCSPSVSVLIPTYEQSRFIGRALDSLQAQVLIDWEAIIVDDGSRDATAEVVSAYLSDVRIRITGWLKTPGWAMH
jgi:cellulose synthase/poly-beta-1,6-N-acetylglucosamine synthase-like glycosyltransferase